MTDVNVAGLLGDLNELKAANIVEHDGDDEVLVRELLAAEADLASFIGRSLEIIATSERHDGGAGTLFLRNWPIKAGTVVVKDTLGIEDPDDYVTLEATNYTVDYDRGRVRLLGWPRDRFGAGPDRWLVTYEGGLPAMVRWDAEHRQRLRQSLYRLVAFRYLQPADAIAKGGQPSRDTLPPDVEAVWGHYRA